SHQDQGKESGNTASPPNLLLIVLDTLRADHLGCYGYDRAVSPEIDAFSKKATLYLRAMASSPWTVPTHASLFTGLYPFEHGVHTYIKEDSDPEKIPETPVHGMDLIYPLQKDRITLAEVFKKEGYRTGAIIANSGYLSPPFQLDQGFDSYDVEPIRSPAINRKAFEWLDRNGHDPFFLFLNYMDTHNPYNITPVPGLLENDKEPDKGDLLSVLGAKVLPGEGSAPKKLVKRVVNQYDTAVANVDKAIGELLDKLKAMELYDRTLIILISDHGEYLGEHMLAGHSKDVYQEALRTLLIVKNPGQTEGRIDDVLVSSTDIPNLALTQMTGPSWKQYLPLFPDAPGNHPVISENYYSRAKDLYNKKWGKRFNRIRTAIYDWPYKYIESSDGCNELYDLQADPMEMNNLWSQEEKIATRLAAVLKEFKARRKAKGLKVGDSNSFVEPDEDLLEQLRNLGYTK
ncbi:MAG: sulfatase, partial [Planctomycetota bacterium]